MKISHDRGDCAGMGLEVRMEKVAKGAGMAGMRKNMSPKRFAQAFLKLDAWFESTRGLTLKGRR
jgi:hypothetical protein